MITYQTINDDYKVPVVLDKNLTYSWLNLWLYSPVIKEMCRMYRSGKKNVVPRKRDLKKMVFSFN